MYDEISDKNLNFRQKMRLLMKISGLDQDIYFVQNINFRLKLKSFTNFSMFDQQFGV